MVRTTRSRSRSMLVGQSVATGIWTNPVNVNRDVVTVESINDSKGRPVSASNLTHSKLDRSQTGGMKGRRVLGPTLDVTLTNYRPEYQISGSASHLDTGAPPVSGLFATLLSRTNPSRPNVVPLNLVQDLYDLPRMLKDVGRLIRTPRKHLTPRDAANQYLGAKFGWIPLIHDIQTVINLQQYVDSRVKELRRLYSEEGLKRRIQLGNNSAQIDGLAAIYSDSYTGFLLGKQSIGTTTRTWGTVRWKPTNLPCPGWQPSDAELIQQAKQVASGFTTEGLIKGAWDLLPWSWMIDWFGNVGDWLTQGSSTIPASPSDICIMRETNTVVQHSLSAKPPAGLEDTGGLVINTTKTRTVGTGSLAASLPTLDGNRLSVLGALFVQRFKH
jgi:hypothetical protein